MDDDDFLWDDKPPRTVSDEIYDQLKYIGLVLESLQDEVKKIDERTVELYQDTGLHWTAVHDRLARIAQAAEAIKWGVIAIFGYLIFSPYLR